MKNLKDCILSLFIGTWLGGLLPACTHDDGDSSASPGEDGGICISIAVSAGGAPTARTEGDDEAGTSVENYINIRDLKIYAFSLPSSSDGTGQASDSELLAQVYPKPENATVKDPVITPVGGTYYLTAELDYTIFSENQTFRMVAVANGTPFFDSEITLTEETLTLKELEEKTFSIAKKITESTLWTPSLGTETGAGIPMFGLREVSLSGYDKKVYNEANPYPLDNIPMLRALAKIEIIDAIPADADQGSISAVSISAYNQDGYLTPALTGGQLNTTGNVESSRIPGNPNKVENGTLFFAKQGDGKTFVAYLPEYQFADDAPRDIITVKITKEDETTADYKLSLSPYDTDGKPVTDPNATGYWNALLRNHIYRYTVTAVDAPQEVELKINYTVCPWEVPGQVNIEFN